MDTNVEGRGFGFERFFKRNNRAAIVNNENEKIDKVPNERNDDRRKTTSDKSGKKSTKASTDKMKADQKPAKSTKSSQKLRDKSSEGNDDKGGGKEACNEFVIKDEVGKIKLSEIINNSIKEAVLNIVKEGVCPLGDSPDSDGRDARKKTTKEENQDKENKPDSPKNQTSISSTAEKTFDSHVCRSQNLSTIRNEFPPCIPCRPVDHGRAKNDDECDLESCPYIEKERKAKGTKRKEQKSSGKIARQVKGSSHFKTDNRRMTGNVNIYICSEANENAKDPKKKEIEEDRCAEESETASESKTSNSTLSISTSKLVAALKKKKRKNLDEESLSCLCEAPEDSKRHRGLDDLNDGDDDDILCLCDDESRDFPDCQSSSIKDCRDAMKFACSDFTGSDVEQDYKTENFRRYASYDKNSSWSCTTVDCPNYRNDRQTLEAERQNETAKLDERCFCCNYKRPQVDRSATVSCDENQNNLPEKSCRREANEKLSKCPCIVEEDEKDSDTDGKVPEGSFTVCVNRSVDEALPDVDDPARKLGTGRSQLNPGDLASRKNEPSKSPERNRTPLGHSAADGEKMDQAKDLVGRTNAESANLSLKSPNGSSRKLAAELKSQDPQAETMGIDRARSKEIQKNPKTTSKIENDSPKTPDKKRKSSYFERSMKRALSLVTRQNDQKIDVSNEKVEKIVSIDEPKPAEVKSEIDESNGKVDKIVSIDAPQPAERHQAVPTAMEKKRNPPEVSCCAAIGKPSNSKADNTLNPERKSRSKISTAIASRKSSIAASKNALDPNLSCFQDQAGTRKRLKSDDNCKCGKPRDSLDCRCKKVEPITDGGCKCCGPKIHQVSSNSMLQCDKILTDCRCGTSHNSPENSNCRRAPKCEFVQVQTRSCPSCKAKTEQEISECCCSPKSLCCCDSGGNSGRGKKMRPGKHRGPGNVPRARCDCKYSDPNDREFKSMICIYCDNPRGKCICKAPIRKCSKCCLPLDVCDCEPMPCRDCNGRRISECNGEQTICVTAWKPKRDVRRYFARSSENIDDAASENCNCWDNSKAYGTDELPYQNRDVFSDVMSELQQKMSGSVCCNVCKNVPCCCCRRDKKSADTNIDKRTCVSSTEERRNGGRSRSDSPADSCNCGPRRKNAGQRDPKTVCDKCRTTPCRCKRSGRSPRKRPQLKCYYCKNQPCTCISGKDAGNSRPFRNADSPRRRGKERRSSCEKNIDTKIDGQENGRRARDNKRFVPCPGKQQRIRKCCYRESPNASNTSHCGERVG